MRHDLGISQRDAAKATGVPYGTWQGMEAGRRTRGLDEWVQRITDTYGYDRDWLMWGTPPEGGDPKDPLGAAPQGSPGGIGQYTRRYIDQRAA